MLISCYDSVYFKPFENNQELFIEISHQDYYKFVDCMPEKREQDGEYVEQTCKARGCVWDESSNPKDRSKFFLFQFRH